MSWSVDQDQYAERCAEIIYNYFIDGGDWDSREVNKFIATLADERSDEYDIGTMRYNEAIVAERQPHSPTKLGDYTVEVSGIAMQHNHLDKDEFVDEVSQWLSSVADRLVKGIEN